MNFKYLSQNILNNQGKTGNQPWEQFSQENYYREDTLHSNPKRSELSISHDKDLEKKFFRWSKVFLVIIKII